MERQSKCLSAFIWVNKETSVCKQHQFCASKHLQRQTITKKKNKRKLSRLSSENFEKMILINFNLI